MNDIIHDDNRSATFNEELRNSIPKEIREKMDADRAEAELKSTAQESENSMETVEDLVTDGQIELAWENANFGESVSKRDVIADTILKCASGYRTGYTATKIAEDLGLVTPDWKLTLRGKRYLFVAFSGGVPI